MHNLVNDVKLNIGRFKNVVVVSGKMIIIDKQELIKKVSASVESEISLDKLLNIVETLTLAKNEADPLLKAKLKGLEVKQQLLFQYDEPLNSQEVADMLGMTRQAVDKRRNHNKLLGLSLGKRGYRYPAWQFDNGDILSGWESVLAALTEISPWGKLQFMLSGDIRLEGKTPIECLQAGEIEKVVAAAKAYGQQVAA